MSKAIVIGSGFGGLASAVRLIKKGYDANGGAIVRASLLAYSIAKKLAS